MGDEKRKSKEDKIMVKLDDSYFSKLLFLSIYWLKICTIHFGCMVIPLGPHLVYTEPKCFVNWFFFPRKRTMGKGHLSMVHNGNRPFWPLHTLDWEPMTITLEALSLVEKAKSVQVRFHTTLEGPTEYICECEMDVQFARIPTWHQMDHVTQIIIKNNLLEVGLTQNRTTMALQNAHNHWFILLYHGRGPAWIKIHRDSMWLRARSRMASHYMMLEVYWDNGLWTLAFGLSQFHGQGSWLVCEVALSNPHSNFVCCWWETIPYGAAHWGEP